jgi:hypothetical protein
MDPKAEALKKMRLKLPTAKAHQAEVPDAKPDDDDKDSSDAAPDLNQKKPLISGDLTSDHEGLLQELMGQISHPGRGAMTLDERAGDKMKEKMASIKKHKKV